MTYREWWDDSGGNQDGKRSTELKAIDKAFNEFTEAGSSFKAGKMTALFDAIGAWQNSKRSLLGNEKWENSKRAGAVRKLVTWAAEEVRKRTVEDGWGTNHNCYAYAMKCRHPQGRGNNARPGVIAGAQYRGEAVQNWKALITAAIQADAAHGGAAIAVLPQATPRPCPASLGVSDYLVALVGFPAGYHFMRRDEATQRWSHKNGSAADVATIAFNIPRNRYLVIDNTVAVDMLINPVNWLDVTRNMAFIAYLSVPAAGILVAGPA